MGAHQPQLEHVGGGVIVDAFAKLVDEPSVLFGPGFFFEEDRP